MPSINRSALALLALLALAACQTTGGGTVGTGPVALTFERADVRIPKSMAAEYGLDLPAAYAKARATAKGGRPNLGKARLDELAAKLPAGTKLPVVVYFHGCAGMVAASGLHLEWLEKLDGFVTIAPDSFARARPVFCFADHTVDISLVDEVGTMRRDEINYAMRRVAALPWVDRNNIFLMGHSQGGGMVAGYRGAQPVRGRILINGGCNTNMGGDGMRDGEALLTFDSGQDLWFKVYDTWCRDYVRDHGGTSVYDPKSRSHNLVLQHWPVVRKFLSQNRR